ncbi:hypothetical protein K443DRAFT_675660 [Laccaria amethystina LaAM-08-1]|uniref:Uncharacterized protein n=1 Tax=Laccaria amethystina LaAM-08-1 TaxID=1095629 RepID=A0A0C9Y3I4_9AGAR|nr:hypothetical protein K443DRAFT_675660 [Laccaria amethystina LaAM-08-1]
MDDDITFGASVWGASEPVDLQKASPSIALTTQITFSDFDDFGPSAEAASSDARDDDFGDFGDAEYSAQEGFGESIDFEEQTQIAGPSSLRQWRPLQLNPFAGRQQIEEEIYEILALEWENEEISYITTNEGIREVEGIGQILLTPESRQMYKMLLNTPPPVKPPNWTRSRIRRQHLIALGIPVNLDEVLPRINGKPLPPLEIHTRPMSAPPGQRNVPHSNSTGPVSRPSSRAGTPQPGQQNILTQFGPKPELDRARMSKLLDIDRESLAMQPLAALERQLADLRMQTANTSSLLTYLLQSRDALQQDSETYNGLIAELVGEAQKIKSGKPTRTMSKRGTS